MRTSVSIVGLLPLLAVLAGCGSGKGAAMTGPGSAADGTQQVELSRGVTVTATGSLKVGTLDGTGDAVFPFASGAPITLFRSTPSLLTAAAPIAFTSFRQAGSDPIAGNFDIYVMNADGTGQTRLTSDPAFDGLPSFSPDGTRIAFASTRDGNDEVYFMNANGTGQVRLTFDDGSDFDPAYSPDGTKITFVSDRDGNQEIYVMNRDGIGPARLTNNAANDTTPSFSPDGTRIAFTSRRDGNNEVYVMNADGIGQTNLTNNAANDSSPAFSPDGRKIAFVSLREGFPDIYVMNADGSAQTRITTTGGEEPAWSPDGTKIAFSTNPLVPSVGSQEVFVMNADGSGQTRLTFNPSADVQPSWPLGHTIGRTLVGPTGSDGTYNPPFNGNPAGVIAPILSPEGLRHALAFYSASPNQLTIQQLTQPTGSDPASSAPVVASVSAGDSGITQVLQDNGLRIPPTALVGTGSATIGPVKGLLVAFDKDTGEVATVFVISRSRAVAPQVLSSGSGRAVLSGSFATVIDLKTGQRYEGVQEVELDAGGHVVSAK